MSSNDRLALDPARPLVKAALTRLEVAFGGREVLCEALAAAPTTEQLTYVIGLVADPRHASRPLGELCDLGGITPDQLLAAYRAGKAARAQALAFAHVYDALPEVAADVMRRAQVHAVMCLSCKGRGSRRTQTKDAENRTAWSIDPCPDCDGTGTVEQEPTLATQELALSMGGMLPKTGGSPTQNIFAPVAIDARLQDASFTQVQKALASLLQAPLTIPATAKETE